MRYTEKHFMATVDITESKAFILLPCIATIWWQAEILFGVNGQEHYPS
jgi:hypothetical protein